MKGATVKRTLVALVENKPGVLNRVASLFRRRNFNIDSLTVGRTETEDLSRMTIVVDGDSDRVVKQLSKLINVVRVEDVTEHSILSRDLALIKVRVTAENRAEVMQFCDIFRAQVVDAGVDSLVLEVTGGEDKIWALVEMLRPHGILEMVRTGLVTMTRGEETFAPAEYVPRPRLAVRPHTNGRAHSVDVRPNGTTGPSPW